MRTNKEKWQHNIEILNKKTNDFILPLIEKDPTPAKYYVVYPTGVISERNVTGVEYHHNLKISLENNKPTKKDVEELINYVTNEIIFSIDNVYFTYTEFITNLHTKGFVRFTDLLNQKNLFHSISDAEVKAKEVTEFMDEKKKFMNDMRQDSAAVLKDYKFLGWQNGWLYEDYDEDGNLCSETGKIRKSVGYSKDKHPEYHNCRSHKHRIFEFSKNTRGTENIVVCRVCQIYWKYDCSG